MPSASSSPALRGHSRTLAQASDAEPGTFEGMTQADTVVRLDIEFDVYGLQLDEDADRERPPVVTLLVNGRDVLRKPFFPSRPPTLETILDVADLIGFEAEQILGDESPLLPTEPPRRVAVYRCSCGYPECRAVAAIITGVGQQIMWSDFRYFGRRATYYGPIDRDGEGEPDGEHLMMPTILFGSDQYRNAIARATEQWKRISKHRRS